MHKFKKTAWPALALAVLFVGSSAFAQQTKPDDGTSVDLPPRGGTTPIPDDGYDGTLASMACTVSNVADTGNVDDVEFEVALEHTWIGDLTIKLVSPAGTVATVQSRAGFAEPADDGTDCCGNSDNLVLASPITYSTTNGSVDAETMGGTDTDNVVCQDDGECSFIPNPDSATDSGDLSMIFDGEAANGDWEVCVGDSGGADTGNLGAATVTVVTGGGGAPAVSITPDPVDFGDVTLGGGAVMSATVENTGDADLNVSDVSAPGGDFAMAGTGTCGGTSFTVAAGNTCTLDYEFTPTAAGMASASVDVTSDAASSPDTFGLQGNGIEPVIVPTLTIAGFGVLLLLIAGVGFVMIRRT